MGFGAVHLPESIPAHYDAFSFSDACVRDLRSLIQEHETMILRDPMDVKKIVKVGSRIAQFKPELLDTPEYERLHQYAHESIRFLSLVDGRPKLQAHLYGDAADITRVIYQRTQLLPDALETGKDYLFAVKRAPIADIEYRLSFLCKLGELGTELLVERNETHLAAVAARELNAFPIFQVMKRPGLQYRAYRARAALHAALPR